jgi:hypothetical protein
LRSGAVAYLFNRGRADQGDRTRFDLTTGQVRDTVTGGGKPC